ncbi:MAG: hypothetical protein HC925_02565, partial [Coleofasciculaceae cyanobacterium SM2_3_26]|nr:hypothetical protein [Coleofasciculaceae cyanobacterium SM2_3_26]
MSIVNRLFGSSAAEDRTAAPNRTFILEPILTPSGILDGGDDTPDPVAIAPPLDLEDIDLPEDLDIETTDLADVDLEAIDPNIETNTETNTDADADPLEVAELQEATLEEATLE